MAKKRGKLSAEEEQYIMNNAGVKTLEEIADALNRTINPVKNFCKKNHLTYEGLSEDEYDDALLTSRLKTKPYWNEVSQQFTDEELAYFVSSWILLMKQFKEDVLYTEELQIKQWITLEIMGNRVMKERRSAHQGIERLETRINDQYQLEPEDRNQEQLMHWETEISMLRNSLSAYTTEHTKILDKVKDITKELKGARSDRIKTIEDSKSSFSGFLKALENKDIRQKVGEDIEIMRMAKDAAAERLAEYHTYSDGYVDQPLLTPETVREDEE